MKADKKHGRGGSSNVNLGFQIAPMVDVVFVIMLFFMVMAGAIQIENAHHTKLPGPPDPKAPPVLMPDEIAINIGDDGQVYLNEDPLDDAKDHNLPELARTLLDLRTTSDAAKSPLVITINANEGVSYERVVNVLDALSRANIENVTFQAVAPE